MCLERLASVTCPKLSPPIAATHEEILLAPLHFGAGGGGGGEGSPCAPIFMKGEFSLRSHIYEGGILLALPHL